MYVYMYIDTDETGLCLSIQKPNCEPVRRSCLSITVMSHGNREASFFQRF